MVKRALLLLTVFFFAALPCRADVEVQGNVSGTWTAEDSPYIVINNIFVQDGQHLIIEPGVRVVFNGYYRLTVNGRITAIGTEQDRIEFVPRNENQPWHGLRISNSRNDNVLSYCYFFKSLQQDGYPDDNSHGGALYGVNSQVNVNHCEFDRNHANGQGGAACFTNTSGDFSFNYMHHNYGYSHIVWGLNARVSMRDNLFEYNEGTYGAALLLDGSSAPVENNIMRYNHSNTMRWGCGLYLVHDYDEVVRNNLIHDNTGGGGVYIGYGARPSVFEHNTIANNQGDNGVFVIYESHINAVNCIFWGNTQMDLAFYEGSAALNYSAIGDVQGADLGEGLVRRDPLFTDPENGDYSLQINSPCRDAGDPDSPDDEDGTRADMGFHFPTPAQITLSEESIHFEPVGIGERVVATFTLHYIDGVLDEVLLQMRAREEDTFFRVSPAEETLELGDSIEVRVIVEPTQEDEMGFKEGMIEFYIEEGAEPFMLVPVDGAFVEGFGRVFGQSVDPMAEVPVAGVEVVLNGFPNNPFVVTTDENGQIDMSHVPSWHYKATITHPDYRTVVSDSIFLAPEEEFELDMVMRYATAIVSPSEVAVSLPANHETTETVTVQNRGSARLHYDVDLSFPGIDDLEYLNLTETIPIEEILHDTRIQGVEVIGNELYVTGGNSGAGTGKVYVINKDHELVRQFDQFAEGIFGLRDITWDGETLWGIDQGIVFQFTPEGELIQQWESPLQSGRDIAWDFERGHLWIGDVTTDFYSIDSDGNVIAQIRRLGTRSYGLSCFPNDPDGARLYLFSNDPEHPHILRKYNPDTGEMITIADLDAGTALAGGTSFSGTWSPLTMQFVALLKGGRDGSGNDEIGFFHISSRQDWISVSPMEGTVLAGSSADLEITLSSNEFPEVWINAEIIIHHDGRGGDVTIPISFLIRAEGEEASQNLNVNSGWSIVSLAVDPADRDVRSIFRPLVDEGFIDIVKDSYGRFYKPAFRDFCNIPQWNYKEGYVVRSSTQAMIRVSGTSVRADEPIPLHAGWQTVAYFPEATATAPIAFADVLEDLIIAKNASGAFYSPRWGYSSLGELRQGRGYWVLMSAPTHLQWNTEGEELASLDEVSAPTHFLSPAVTGCDMSMLLMTRPDLTGEIGVYASGALVGGGVISEGICGVVVRGLDEVTGFGATEGAPLSIVYWDGRVESPASVKLSEGKATYETNSYAIGTLEFGQTPLPLSFGLHPAAPNPFNGTTTLAFDLPVESDVSLKIFDTQGRLIKSLVSGKYEAGVHSVSWNASAQAAGTYICRMDAGSFHQTAKLLLVK